MFLLRDLFLLSCRYLHSTVGTTSGGVNAIDTIADVEFVTSGDAVLAILLFKNIGVFLIIIIFFVVMDDIDLQKRSLVGSLCNCSSHAG